MDLYNAIKQIVDEYLAVYQPADLVYGIWGASSVKIDGKPMSVPIDMVDVPEGTTVTIGKRVTLMMKQGGQKYALIGVLG
ncbi:hypothetical protein EQM14_01685 [Caproiciproducens sp. NJN-50]|uniref:hypothetical protein n=1 Tax=Caproiciproducens sp. NJN-50 TaxID=2507162 RepID=UPI000FFE0745|nr:hypothetical protein [Caproiciproducens sp. NJN-50]QAT48595.1 hypothetical protein EQM14_01685 [Caproiciproducens sp. NJN-50]